MFFNHKIRDLFSRIVLVYLTIIILGNCLCIHTHIGKNGKIVVHSHPFTENDHNSDSEVEHFALIFESSYPISLISTPDINDDYKTISYSKEHIENNKTLEIISKQITRGPPHL